MLDTIRDLVDLAPRATGTDNGRATAAYVKERLERAGLPEVLVEETSSFHWEVTEQRLVIGSESVVAKPIQHCFIPGHEAVGEWSTGPEGLTASLVDIGGDSVKEAVARGVSVRGSIVLFDLAFTMTLGSMLPLTHYVHDPGRKMMRREVLASRNPYVTSLTTVMEEAAAAGAVGVIGVLRDYAESVNYHNEYYRKHVLSLPGFWITRSTGDRIRNELASGAIDSATLHLTVQRSAVTAQTVIGVLPGRTDDAIMVQSHHDSVGPGAVEDGTGASAVIALAEYYAAQAAVGARREKTLLFITFDSHFTGYHAHQDFVRRHVLADAPRWQIVLNATIEHIGLRAVRGADGGFEVLQETEPRGIFENVSPRLKLALVKAIRRHGLGQTVLVNASPLEFGDLGIPTDASFTLTAGVPTISLVSGPLYLYDDADTIDKVDVEQLEPVARAFADIVDAADRMPSGRLGLIPRRLRARLPRRGRAVDA